MEEAGVPVMAGLFEELSQTFPLEVVEPYGEVLVVPVKAFKPEWRSQLESESVQTYTNAYRGQTCFFLRKKRLNQSVQEQPQHDVAAATSSQAKQNIEDAVVQLIREGLSFNQILERLGLSRVQLMGYISSLKKKGVLDKIGWKPQRHLWKPSTRDAKNEPAEPSLNSSNLPIREMLEASLKLLDEHPKVVRLLLEKCLEALT
jgi:DNA-binding CsgD family transcriptional regulator